MDPLTLLLQVWWVAPAAAGAGGASWIALRSRRSARARRLELEAARHDVVQARQALSRARADVLVARAGVARAEADRAAARLHPGELAAARRAVQHAESQVRAAWADLRARRADVRAARIALPPARAGADALPLARLMARHDALRVRWMAYETDPAKLIDYPSMTDAAHPATAAFLEAQAAAQWLRPTSREAVMRPADFAAYRAAVIRAERAFDAAEHAARGGAGASSRGDAGERWADLARDVVDSTSRALAASAEAWARAAAWRRSRRRPPE
ncbi:hypothetical protein [Microbacterium sp. 10M-3C3]|uniref:hypothetical protein n=1 Tax=Microbacterium sp. 10M-3C3 TaxID=2483401 RepID=UPI000F634D34|nr:hypothetical protein [Microbacterium sp. 10M-3C3]